MALLPLLPALAGALLPPPQQGGLPLLELERDDTHVRASAAVRVLPDVLPDESEDGVLWIGTDGVVVDLAGQHLRGAAPGTPPEEYAGIGIVIAADRVTVRNARISGYRCAIRTLGADGLVLEDCDVSDNYRQRLASTPEAEAQDDWLWPHDNDANEWFDRYSAAIWIEECTGVTVRRCRARDGQNGLVLDRVDGSQVYDNDFSFLSGWGIAMWRSSDDVIAKNALDFCVRGYEHGVYNRGQDSAGLLMFEQCSRNVVGENSITHGGDGVFAFSGKEALGDGPPPSPDFDYADRGNRGNLFFGNDLSYAAAHGLELTFAFDNAILGNRLVENAICGVWGGYSRRTRIQGNVFEGNGDAGYGLERGGVNVEHGSENRIEANVFRRNACGVHLWWDPDEHLTQLPWALANGVACADNAIVGNTFESDLVAIHLREAERTTVSGNRFQGVGEEVRATPGSEPLAGDAEPAPPPPARPQLPGLAHPVGARASLRGRAQIVMTPYGPWDHERPLLRRVAGAAASDVWRLLGAGRLEDVRVEGAGVETRPADDGAGVEVRTSEAGCVAPYRLTALADGVPLSVEGCLANVVWELVFFPSPVDPRTDEEAWRRGAAGDRARHARTSRLVLPFGGGGPASLAAELPELAGADLPADHFGTAAATTVRLPAGRWRIVTRSDDGLRVRVDGELVIDDWTYHAPREHVAELDLPAGREVELEVEHFELDGNAVLDVHLEPARP